jgi:MFS family permease
MLGRMAMGWLSDWVTTRLGKPARVLFLVFSAFLMGLVQLWFAFAKSVLLLYPGVIALGIAGGGVFFCVPTLTIEFFGFKNFATNFGIINLAAAAGSPVFSTLIAGMLNDHYKEDGNFLTVDYEGGPTTSHCNNKFCFRYSFWANAGACGIGVVLSLWLWHRRITYERALIHRQRWNARTGQ